MEQPVHALRDATESIWVEYEYHSVLQVVVVQVAWNEHRDTSDRLSVYFPLAT